MVLARDLLKCLLGCWHIAGRIERLHIDPLHIDPLHVELDREESLLEFAREQLPVVREFCDVLRIAWDCGDREFVESFFVDRDAHGKAIGFLEEGVKEQPGFVSGCKRSRVVEAESKGDFSRPGLEGT